jgi:selenocysteine lyase/cysteine desulfurase
VQSLGVDFLLCSAYKFYGPHVGVLYSRPGALDGVPTDRLSTQDPAPPYRIETGTLNHAAIAGVHAAINYIASFGRGATLRECVVNAMSSIARYEHSLASYYHSHVRALPGVRVWGPDFASAARAPTVSITLQKHTPDQAAAALGKQNICVWNGNFYAARAVEILGLEAGGGLLRTGISMYTTQTEIDHLLAAIAAL